MDSLPASPPEIEIIQRSTTTRVQASRVTICLQLEHGIENEEKAAAVLKRKFEPWSGNLKIEKIVFADVIDTNKKIQVKLAVLEFEDKLKNKSTTAAKLGKKELNLGDRLVDYYFVRMAFKKKGSLEYWVSQDLKTQVRPYTLKFALTKPDKITQSQETNAQEEESDDDDGLVDKNDGAIVLDEVQLATQTKIQENIFVSNFGFSEKAGSVFSINIHGGVPESGILIRVRTRATIKITKF